MDRHDRAVGPGISERRRPPALDAEVLLAAALKRARREAFDDSSFVLPLRRLIASCNAESDLNSLGRNAVKYEIHRSLHNLLEFERRERRNPGRCSRAPSSGPSSSPACAAQRLDLPAPPAGALTPPWRRPFRGGWSTPTPPRLAVWGKPSTEQRCRHSSI